MTIYTVHRTFSMQMLCPVITECLYMPMPCNTDCLPTKKNSTVLQINNLKDMGPNMWLTY